MSIKRMLVMSALGGVMLPASAHHSASIFDRTTALVLNGTVQRFDWANPHVYLYVETADSSGNRAEWAVETDATPILIRSGWTPTSLVPGDRVTVRANPDRDTARNHALLVSLEKRDGTILTPRASFSDRRESRPAPHAGSLEGIWEVSYRDVAEFYRRLSTVRLTDRATAARSQYDMRVATPEAECIAYPSPALLVGFYLNEIRLLPDRAVIRSEFFNVERTIHMDGRGHPEDTEATVQGHSIGWWDGNVLVVDTRHFAPHRSPVTGRGVPSGTDKHVVERYRLSEDGTQLLIDFVMTDPEYLAEPFTGTAVWNYAPELQMHRFGCQPQEASRFMFE